MVNWTYYARFCLVLLGFVRFRSVSVGFVEKGYRVCTFSPCIIWSDCQWGYALGSKVHYSANTAVKWHKLIRIFAYNWLTVL